MAQRSKRRVKQRARSHQKLVKAKKKMVKHARRKVGYGTKKRRAKKARKGGRR